MWETGTIDPEGKAGGPVLTNAMNVNTWRTYSYFKAFRDAPTTSPLYQNSQLVASGQFAYDAINDRLPTVSWLFPSVTQTEHPNFGIAALPAFAEQFLASAIGAVAANPDVRAKTVFIISWDENDGLFDHVPPPTAPPGTPDESTTLISPGGIHGDGLSLGASFRVGCIIVSPWTAGGWVCGETFDHTSQLRFLEAMTGVEASNISAWRRKTFGDLTSAFRFHGQPADPPTFADTTTNLTLTQYTAAHLPAPVAPTAGHQVPPSKPQAVDRTHPRAVPGLSPGLSPDATVI
jgi:phospholipase C